MAITSLTVLYDADCPTCQRAKAWISQQSQLIPIGFVPAGSPEALERFPGLDHRRTMADVTVVADTGAVFHKERAWLVILWALARWRGVATHLSTPLRRPLVRLVASGVDGWRRAVKAQLYRELDADRCQRCERPLDGPPVGQGTSDPFGDHRRGAAPVRGAGLRQDDDAGDRR